MIVIIQMLTKMCGNFHCLNPYRFITREICRIHSPVKKDKKIPRLGLQSISTNVRIQFSKSAAFVRAQIVLTKLLVIANNFNHGFIPQINKSFHYYFQPTSGIRNVLLESP